MINNAKVEFESMPCDFCDSNNFDLLFKTKIVGDDFLDEYFYELEFPLVKCKKCNLVYINLRPVKESMKLFYPPAYYGNQQFERHLSYRIRKKFQQILFKVYGSKSLPGWIFSLLIEPHVQIVIGPPKVKSKVLEIGFGLADLLDRLKNAGWDTYGIETDKEAAKKAEKRGHKTFVGYVEDYDFKDLKFDLVVMQNVLEHVYSPTAVLRKTNLILKKGGQFIISVPNFGCSQSKIFKEYWYGLDAPRHLFHFTPQTLRNMLKSSNFEEINYKNTSFLKKLLNLKIMMSFTRNKLPLSRIFLNILKEYFIYLPCIILKRRYKEDFGLIFTLHLKKTADL